MTLARDRQRKYALLNALSSMDKPSLSDLHKATGVPKSTLKRQISGLRDEFGMRILFVRESAGERGASGYYLLTDWGIIDRAAFVRKYG